MGLGFSICYIHIKHRERACRQAHPWALREGQPHREAGAQSLGASYVWEVAGLSNSGGGATKLRPQRGGRGCGCNLTSNTAIRE
jgi:hypothetical protein